MNAMQSYLLSFDAYSNPGYEAYLERHEKISRACAYFAQTAPPLLCESEWEHYRIQLDNELDKWYGKIVLGSVPGAVRRLEYLLACTYER